MPLASLFTLEFYGEAAMASKEVSLGFAQGDIEGTGRPQGTLAGAGIVSNADATRLVNQPATVVGSGIVSTASPRARAKPTCTVSIGARPSAFDIAQEVWQGMATSYNSEGSMGEKMNRAGKVANPWTEIIENGLSAAQMMRVLLAVAAGKTLITDLGGGLATVKFKSQDSLVDRVIANMDGSERIGITLDTGNPGSTEGPDGTDPNEMAIEGRIYKTVQIGTQTWMAENLDVEFDLADCWFYPDGLPSNKAVYGLWYDVTLLSTLSSLWTGWHIPTPSEWETLYNFAVSNLGYTQLNDPNYWINSPFYPDTYGFGARPAGSFLNGGINQPTGPGGGASFGTSFTSPYLTWAECADGSANYGRFDYTTGPHKLSIRLIKD